MDPAIGGLVAAGVIALGTFVSAAWKMSGRIGTSESAELWEEGRSIREWTTARIMELTAEVAVLKHQLTEADGIKAHLESCRTAIETLTAKLAASENRVEELEEEAKE